MDLQPTKKSYSLKPDMAFGWKPENVQAAPIPMYFDYETFELPINPLTKLDYPIYFSGERFLDSL